MTQHYYYLYRQTSINGKYNPPAINIAIQAETPHEANTLAQQHGLHFHSSEEEQAHSSCTEETHWSYIWEEEENEPNRYDIFDTKEEIIEEYESFPRNEENNIPTLLIVDKNETSSNILATSKN